MPDRHTEFTNAVAAAKSAHQEALRAMYRDTKERTVEREAAVRAADAQLNRSLAEAQATLIAAPVSPRTRDATSMPHGRR
jgi:hypothetical protein